MALRASDEKFIPNLPLDTNIKLIPTDGSRDEDCNEDNYGNYSWQTVITNQRHLASYKDADDGMELLEHARIETRLGEHAHSNKDKF